MADRLTVLSYLWGKEAKKKKIKEEAEKKKEMGKLPRSQLGREVKGLCR